LGLHNEGTKQQENRNVGDTLDSVHNQL